MLRTIQIKDTPNGQNESELGERLNLAVGGSGVIGRLLSVVAVGGEIGNVVIGWDSAGVLGLTGVGWVILCE